MRKLKSYLYILSFISVFLVQCSSVPITGRKQLNLIPASTMLSMSYQQYGQFLKENKLSTDQANTQLVKNVGLRIQKAVEQYFAQHNLSGELKGYQWEFNLVESKDVNAWCMPGGKVVVYTGILPITKDEFGLATVMGHEIAHAVAEHGSERMSQGLVAQLGGIALDKALESKPDATRNLYMAAFGLGAQLGVLLPFSRLHESEADRLGLIFMAMAGYDPNNAVGFWQRMAEMSKGQKPPEFLSTHPSDETRIRKIKEQLPEAMKYYKKSSELEFQRSKIYSDKDAFKLLKEIKESGQVHDELLKRQLELIYNAYLRNQIAESKLKEITERQSEIEKKFSTFRANVNGKQLTDNQVEEILKNSVDSRELEAAWTASKKIGSVVAQDVINLVKLRNEAAKELGFKNFHYMSLKLSEQDPEEIEKLFDELDNLTRNTFANLMNEIDEYLSKRYKISKNELMPWHYQNRYFQEAPAIYDFNLDTVYKDKNIVELTKRYYESIGLKIDDIISASDLYEKENKYQHAYCTTIERNNDVRVVMNVKPNMSWMGTSLHEFGHAVYDKYIDQQLPWELREPAHIFTTEAIAMLFGRLAYNTNWMKEVAEISDDLKNRIGEISFKTLQMEQIIFSRWVQVVYRFEKEMYNNPDQDLNKLWWDLAEKYQMMKRPEGRNEPDWASKIHIALYPAYYHNYMLGELLASQIGASIAKNITHSDVKKDTYYKQDKVGDFLRSKVFSAGERYTWNEMIERATGEKLTPKYYAEQFVR